MFVEIYPDIYFMACKYSLIMFVIIMIFDINREKKKEKDREELWKKLEKIEFNSKNKMNNKT